jgi:hypothetical protein
MSNSNSTVQPLAPGVSLPIQPMTISPSVNTAPTAAAAHKIRAGKQRWDMLNRFVDTRMATLKATEVLAWLCLFRHTRNGVCKVSQKRIAGQCGRSERMVRSALIELQQLGLVSIRYKGGKNKGCTMYAVSS